MTTCATTNCVGVAVARGLCTKHYQRFKKLGHTELPETPEQRFWAKVEKSDGCWLWRGTVAGGYGQCRSAPKVRVAAHRFSYNLHFGPIPDGLYVCHRCDTPLCVNPAHLFLGTDSDNMRDMVSKGRHPKQRRAYRAKLTADQVRQVRHSTESNASLAAGLGVDDNTIANIRKGRTWRALQ